MTRLLPLAAGVTMLAASVQGRVLDWSQGNMTTEAFLDAPQDVPYDGSQHDHELSLEERDCAQQPSHFWKIVGDGSPHQNYIITQVRDTYVTCPGTVTKGHSHSTSWQIGGNLNIAKGAFEFGDMGFAVGQEDSDEFQTQFSCANTRGGMCLQRFTAVTAITVDFFTNLGCGLGTHKASRGVVYLPNKDGRGSTWARGMAYGGETNMIQCRGNADREIQFYCGPPGGPEYWDKPGVVPGPWEDTYQQAMEPKGCGVPFEVVRLGDN